jgi:polyisoprenoid-binding protein YceI
MKPTINLFRVTIMALCLALPYAANSADTPRGNGYLLDLTDAAVSFSVKVLGLFPVNGHFERVHGGFLFTDSCKTSRIAFTIESASVTTRNRVRDRIVRGPALLDSERYPVISFSSTRIDGDANGPRRIVGDLHLNGRTREIGFDLAPPDRNSSSAAAAGRYRAYTRISRADFGISSPIVGVSDTINIEVAIDIKPGAGIVTAARQEEVLP